MDTDHLVDAMTRHWTERLNNVVNERLQGSWRQTFKTFNRKIAEHGTDFEGDWHVLSPKTGTGKSESLKIYAAETADPYTAPGILIVVRLIQQADEFVSDINMLAGRQVAAARHSASDSMDLATLQYFPVLVITHAAFTGRPRRNRALWDQYMAHNGRRRQLVVIDEALDVLDIARVTFDDLDRLRGHIPTCARERWPEGYRAIQALGEILQKIARKPNTAEARVVMNEDRRRYLELFEDGWNGLDQIEEIRAWMKSDEHRYLLGRKRVDNDAEQRQKRIYDKIFADLAAVYTQFIVHMKQGKLHTLNTARYLLPDDQQGCVVLDATADTNALYECMERDTYSVIKHPAISSRTYQNVTLKASFGHAVGRSSLVRGKVTAKSEAPKLMDALRLEHDARQDTDCPMERVLIVCHKDAEQYLAGFELPFEYHLAHYGALDGRNDFRECDSVAIFGLDYRNPADASVSFMALQGSRVQTTEWFRDPSRRSFGGHSDIREALNRGWITSSLIQAVNRIRTRSVIDEHGNCPPSYVYVLLPDNSDGKAIYNTLVEQMPGMKSEKWIFEGARQARRSQHEGSLRKLIEHMEPGEQWTATDLRQHLQIPKRGWERLTQKLRGESALAQYMVQHGVRYEVERRGKTQVARLVKS